MEAHAKDEWPLGTRRSLFDQHKTTQDRINVARYLLGENSNATFTSDMTDDARIPLVVDPIGNPFNNIYAAWPESMYIMEGDRMAYMHCPIDPLLHDVARQYLENRYDNKA